ncbi:redoxin domain-containing protein [Rubritalea spongiae]|uniref:thioredoxin-dependent peroxiredoxin n=1 Tax=Rubritalea spongiae TaxID=430797 RepID=A0ABW5E2F7_9BACT
MKNLREQTEAQIKKSRNGNPQFMEAVDQVIEAARQFEEGKNALALGEVAPSFELPNFDGASIKLADLLAKGAVVLSFYRGSWCPYCNLELKALQAHLPEIRELGAELVFVTPQTPDMSLAQSEKDVIEFPVLSDQGAEVAARYGVAWKVPEVILEHMRLDRKLDLEMINNGNGEVLPIPAIFVLDRYGVVVWKYVDVDYRKRAEPAEMIEALRKLSDVK